LNTTTHVSRVAALLAGLVLASCGGDAPPEAPNDQAAPAAQAPAAGADEIQVYMTPRPDFVAEGSVIVRRSGDVYNVSVEVDTHIGPGDYPMHIHQGTCESGGPVVVTLSSVEGHEAGEGRATSTFPASELSPGTSYFVQIHHAQGGAPIACADLPPLGG
jgi:hypothetical protein